MIKNQCSNPTRVRTLADRAALSRLTTEIINRSLHPDQMFELIANDFGQPGIIWYHGYAEDLRNYSPEMKPALPLQYGLEAAYDQLNHNLSTVYIPDFRNAPTTAAALGKCVLLFNSAFHYSFPDELSEASITVQVKLNNIVIESFVVDATKKRERYLSLIDTLLLKLQNGMCDIQNSDAYQYLY